MAALHVAEYREDRLGLVVVNHGTIDIHMSSDRTDVEATIPFGFCLEPCIPFVMPWILWGEIIWSDWWVECSQYRVTVYEWFNANSIDPYCLTPMQTKCDRKRIIEPRIPRPVRPQCQKQRASVCKAIAEMRARLTKERESNETY